MLKESYRNMIKSRIEGREEQLLEVQIAECLKYLAIVSLTQGRRLPVTPDVDDVWHELILQTRDYRELCETLPGARFVDHESIDPASYNRRVGDSTFVEEWVQWVPDYVQSFGPFTELAGRQWNVVNFLRDVVGMSLEEINELGRTSKAKALVPATSPWSELS